MGIEISKEELVQLMQDDKSCDRQRFSEWQLKFALEHHAMVGHPRYIEYMKHFGFNMFQIRYLIKLFSK